MENDKGAKLVHFELADHVERVDATPESSAAPPQKTIYRDTKFIGTYIAICLGVLSSYGSYVMPATSLQLINADIGPSENITWVSLSWILCGAVGYTVVGNLSDIFGRRWFFMGASALAAVGCIVGATANSVESLIGANVLIGLAASAQLSFSYVVAELVPVRDRFYAMTLIILAAVPFATFGPYISRLFIVHTSHGWRWDYYLSIICNVLSTVLYFFFYYPTAVVGSVPNDRTKIKEMKDLDYVGMFLFVAGFLLFAMGLSWGGLSHPWDSVNVLATMIIGFALCVVFVLYESFMPPARPLIPMRLFKNTEYAILTGVTAVGSMLYFSLNIIFSTMVTTLFTDDVVKGGLLSCAIGGGVGCGQIFGSIVAIPGGHIKWKLIASTICMTAFTAALAGAKTENAAVVLATLAAMSVGVLQIFGLTMVTMVVDPLDLGTAGGVFGSICTMGGVIATSILTAVLNTEVADNIKSDLVPALITAGLPIDSVAEFLSAFQAGSADAVGAVSGVTPKILYVAKTGSKEIYSDAFTVVYLVTLAFGGFAVVASFWTPSIESRLTNEVARQLGGSNQENKKTQQV